MPYYKVIAKTGHRGARISGEIVIYLSASGIMEATRSARFFPAVKHGSHSAIVSAEPVDEMTFVLGNLTSAYVTFDYYDDNQKIVDLDKIASRINNIDNFETSEGKMLKNFCNRYCATKDKDLKESINQEYKDWASQLTIRKNEYGF